MEVAKLAFTICSNNYLAQAKTLGDSFLNWAPDFNFIIGLVDEYDAKVDYDFFKPHKIIPVREIGINNFNALVEKYNIIELNTAVKSSFIKYFFNQNSSVESVYYFDPDIMLFNDLSDLHNELSNSNILITPHINTPIPLDNSHPNENLFLNFGIYNLGFIGVKRSVESFRFLDWWEERTLKHGFSNVKKGFFVDQLWINLIPLFFNKVKILKNFGYNAAPWNLHERKHIKKTSNGFYMSDTSKLVFFHFSSYSYENPSTLSKYYSRYSFENCPDLKAIYQIYHSKLVANNVGTLTNLKCAYMPDKVLANNKKAKVWTKFKDFIKLCIPPIVLRLRPR